MPIARPAVRDLLGLGGSVALSASPFLPWLRIGDVSLRGIADPAGIFVLGLGLVGVVAALITMVWRVRASVLLLFTGIAATTTLAVIFWTGPRTIAERAEARAEALALVDNVAMEPVPPVTRGVGLAVGVAGAVAAAFAGVTGRSSRAS